MVRLKDRLDDSPGRLDRILTGEYRSIAGHGICQKPLVGRFLSRIFLA